MEKRLLVIDDSPFLRMVIKSIALESGWTAVDVAASATDGLDLYRRHRPTLVILGIDAPPSRALEVLMTIRGMSPSAAVVILGATDGRDVVARLMRAGAAEFISKPFDRQRLIEVLNSASSRTPA